MATERIPVDMRIAFTKAVLDSERLLLETHRADSFDGAKERARLWKRIDPLLEELHLMLIERDQTTNSPAPGVTT